MWGEGGNDLYLIDANTGARTLGRRSASRSARSSRPVAATSLYFDNGRWYSYDVAAERTARPDRRALVSTSSRRRGTRRARLRRGASAAGRRATGRCSPTTASTSGRWTRRAHARPRDAHRLRRPTRASRLPRGGSRSRRALRSTRARRSCCARSTTTTKASGFYEDRFGGNKPPRRIVMDDVAYGDAGKARRRRDVRRHPRHLHRLPEPLRRRVADDADADLRREPAAEGLQLGHGGARALDERRRRAAQGPALQAGELRSDQEVPDDRRTSTSSLSNSLHNYVRAERAQRHQPDALRLERLPRVRAGHRLRERAIPGRARSSRSCPACRRWSRAASSIRRDSASRASRGAATRRRT